MTDTPEVIEVDTEVVDWEGGGALGHPRVWLNMAGQGEIDCPYCDRQFVLKKKKALRREAGTEPL